MKIFWQTVSVALVLSLPFSASGYIPSANFIIKMMLEGNQAIQDIRVEQTATVFDKNSGRESFQIPEVLYLRVPDSYRLDITLPEEKKTVIYSEGETLTIVGSKVISHSQDEKSIFKDFFIKQSVAEIIELLHSRNVNTQRMGLGRFDGRIAYIIGAKERETKFPQLWIEKDNFLPLRFIVEEKKKDSITTLEIRYLNYQHVDGKYWYPSTVEFYYDNKLALRYQTQKVVVNTNIPDNLFDISKIKKEYIKMTDER